jgi:hypothetical protein
MEKGAEIALQFVDGSDKASLYTISFIGETETEFGKFISKYKNEVKLNKDYQLILAALVRILKNGALERYFRPEGKMNDGVCALPIDCGKLRLYCLRLTDKILILGNGGKKSTKTYNEDLELSGYVLTLQKFEALIKLGLKNKAIEIEETQIIGYEDKTFQL